MTTGGSGTATLAWFKNGAGWAKILILIAGLAVGYAFRVERDTYRVDELERWRIDHTTRVSEPAIDRLRLAEMQLATVASDRAAMRAELSEIKAELRDIRILLNGRSR